METQKQFNVPHLEVWHATTIFSFLRTTNNQLLEKLANTSC